MAYSTIRRNGFIKRVTHDRILFKFFNEEAFKISLWNNLLLNLYLSGLPRLIWRKGNLEHFNSRFLRWVIYLFLPWFRPLYHRYLMIRKVLVREVRKKSTHINCFVPIAIRKQSNGSSLHNTLVSIPFVNGNSVWQIPGDLITLALITNNGSMVQSQPYQGQSGEIVIPPHLHSYPLPNPCRIFWGMILYASSKINL